MTDSKGSGPPILGKLTAYISEVNVASKVKSDAHVAMNKNSDPVQKLILGGGWGGRCPQLNFFQKLTEMTTNESS